MRRFTPFAAAGALYLVLACALTWPLVLRMGSHVAADLGDPLLNMWIFAWNARVLPLTDTWWNQPQFFPTRGVTAFSEHLLGLSPLTTPVLLATGNAVLAYNIAFLVSFPLAALAGHALGWVLTRRHDAALVAGLAFGFAPYRAAQLAHVQVLSSYWMPLSLVGLILYFRDRRMRWLVLFAAAWMMQALTCGYYFFYLSVLIGLWLAWFVVGREPWKDLARVFAVWAVAVLALAPILYGYLRFQRMYGFRRWPDEIARFSADVVSLLSAPPNLLLWGWLNVFHRAESELFPGVTIPLLIVAGVVAGWTARAAARPPLRAVRVLLVLAIVFLAVAATPLVFGAWKLEPFGIRILSVGTPHKPLSVALVLLAAAGALNPTIRSLWARRSAFAFFVLAAAVMWLLSLGPTPTFLDQPVIYKAPYTWLMEVPGVEGVRVPARFWMLAVLCLAAAAALALVKVTSRWPRSRGALATLACIGILADGWTQAMPVPRAPDPSPTRAPAVSRLDLPLTDAHDLMALYWGLSHQRPLLNGYSGYFAPHYWVLKYLLGRDDDAALAHLAQFGDIEVVVDLRAEGADRWRRYVERYPEARLVFADGRSAHYHVPRSAASLPHRPMGGAVLPIVASRASIRPDLLPQMFDGDLLSRWDGQRSQEPGDYVVLDLGATRRVRGIELALGGYVADFPRELRIETSLDAAAWEAAWEGGGGGPALTGALASPRAVPLTFNLSQRPARFIRLTQLGSDPVFYWTIAELRVFGT